MIIKKKNIKFIILQSNLFRHVKLDHCFHFFVFIYLKVSWLFYVSNLYAHEETFYSSYGEVPLGQSLLRILVFYDYFHSD